MEDNTKSATKRHKLTTAGLVTAGIGVLLFVLGLIGSGNGSPWLITGIMLAILLIPAGVILMVAGWMIRMRQAAEAR